MSYIDIIKDAVSIMHPQPKKKPLRLFDTTEQDLELEILKVYMSFFIDFKACQYQGKKWMPGGWSWSMKGMPYGINFSMVECLNDNGSFCQVMSFEEFNMWFQDLNVQ